MHVVAFAPSTKLALQNTGGVATDGFPMTKAYVDGLPIRITIPMVLAFYAEAGGDYDPRRYMVATSPDGERLNVEECTWHWPDNPGVPVKFQVLTRYLNFLVDSEGVYTIGLYDDPDATESDHLFPLPVIKTNPLLMQSPPPSTPIQP